MAAALCGAGSRHGEHGAVLEAGLDGTGSASGTASGTSAVQSSSPRTQVGAGAAQEILAEIGPPAAAFPSAEQLASWIGVCPGSHESAGHNRSGRCANGNRFLRRLLVPSGSGRRSNQRELFRVCLQTPGRPPGIYQSSLGHRPQAPQNRVEHLTQGRSIRRIRRGQKSQRHPTRHPPSPQSSSPARIPDPASATYSSANPAVIFDGAD